MYASQLSTAAFGSPPSFGPFSSELPHFLPMNGRTCTWHHSDAAGFYLLFAYIQLWSPICTALNGEKGDK